MKLFRIKCAEIFTRNSHKDELLQVERLSKCKSIVRAIVSRKCMSVELTYLYIVILENSLFLKIALLSYDFYRLKQEDTGQKKEVSFHD